MKGSFRVQHVSRFALCTVIVGALATTICARQSSAQGKTSQTHVDPALAARGGQLFKNKGCVACHTIGSKSGTLEGPDLAGVTDRRTAEWLHAWLKDPVEMINSDDPVAADMYKRYHNVKMPNMHLNDSDIAAIVAYLSQHH